MRHEFTASQALELVMGALRGANPDLAERAQIAIDAGVDVDLEQDIHSGKGRNTKSSKRKYRENRPFTEAEAIDVVLEVLEAHLIIQRRVVNSAVKEFSNVPLGTLSERLLIDQEAFQLEVEPRELAAETGKVQYSVSVLAGSEGTTKEIEVVVPESARRAADNSEVQRLKTTTDGKLKELETLVTEIHQLTRFEE